MYFKYKTLRSACVREVLIVKNTFVEGKTYGHSDRKHYVKLYI